MDTPSIDHKYSPRSDVWETRAPRGRTFDWKMCSGMCTSLATHLVTLLKHILESRDQMPEKGRSRGTRKINKGFTIVAFLAASGEDWSCTDQNRSQFEHNFFAEVQRFREGLEAHRRLYHDSRGWGVKKRGGDQMRWFSV